MRESESPWSWRWCTLLMWVRTWERRDPRYSQWGHWCGLSPVWVRRWRYRLCLSPKLLPQRKQVWPGPGPDTVYICRLRGARDRMPGCVSGWTRSSALHILCKSTGCPSLVWSEASATGVSCVVERQWKPWWRWAWELPTSLSTLPLVCKMYEVCKSLLPGGILPVLVLIGS